ncbi:MAG TPA: FAD-linked oxidase C-terminal domain-containing protein, partial [Pirellulales bacterium]|nr:FAD-linked oxidase C-terminal domain-containing protein [Pirellulales bacterium]
DAPLVVKCGVRPGAVCDLVDVVRRNVPRCRIQAHAGSGTVLVVIDELPPEGAAKLMIQRLRPAVQSAGGHAIVWSTSDEDLTRQATLGPAPPGFAAMQSVKQQFDPKNLLNPGRYFFA